MEKNIVLEKSLAFALRIVKLSGHLAKVKHEFTLSNELLRAGTNVGKHVKEGTSAESREVFAGEFGIARRKASETEYWLQLLLLSGLLSEEEFESIDADRIQIAKLINAIITTTRKNV